MSEPVTPPGHSLAQSFARAARIVARVLQGTSLDASLAKEPGSGRLRAAGQDLAYRALRGYGRLPLIVERLAQRGIQDERLTALLYVALAELQEGTATSYTVVHQAVEAANELDLARAGGFVNAVLRNYLRRQRELEGALTSRSARYRHPDWWIDRLEHAYPHAWEGILAQDNAHPPMALRVNRRRTDPATYLDRLQQAGMAASASGEAGLLLEKPRPVGDLPGFGEGAVSVQDLGAQLAARLLDVQPGMTVLDACAAPGGKACHILESVDCELTALELSATRAGRIGENLERLGLKATVRVGDALQAAALFQGVAFDRILLDAPCTASGVVRRHPDLKWLRRERDLETLPRQQAALLEALWPLVKAGGKLLYATCSLFPEENGDQVAAFLKLHPEANQQPLTGLGDGQMLPTATCDGFYYALLSKAPS